MLHFSLVPFIFIQIFYCKDSLAQEVLAHFGTDIPNCRISEVGNCSWITKTKCELGRGLRILTEQKVHPNLSPNSCKEYCECKFRQCTCLKCESESFSSSEHCASERRY